MTDAEEWMTPAEAGRKLRVDRRTVYRYIADGRLTAHPVGGERKHGRPIRLRRSEVLRLLGGASPDPGGTEP